MPLRVQGDGGTCARAPRRNFRASGPSAGVQNGRGRGFICLGGCGAVFDTPAEALKQTAWSGAAS